MYFILGKFLAVLFFLSSIAILFTKKGRHFIADIISDTIMADILEGDWDDFDDVNGFAIIGLGAIVVAVFFCYFSIAFIISLLIILVYPLVLCFMLVGLIVKLKARRNNKSNY